MSVDVEKEIIKPFHRTRKALEQSSCLDGHLLRILLLRAPHYYPELSRFNTRKKTVVYFKDYFGKLGKCTCLLKKKLDGPN